MFFHKIFFKILPLIFGAVLLIFSKSAAQKPAAATLLRGSVADAETGEMLPFVSVSLKSRTAGTWTDTLGAFAFRVEKIAPGDSLQVSYVGYSTQTFAFAVAKNEQFFSIKIKPSTSALGEVVITADPNPGKTLMKKVIAAAPKNDPARFSRLDARRWTRDEVAALDPKIAADSTGRQAAEARGLFASRVRVFEKYRPADDTLRGETPLFFSEKLADYTLENRPFGENERVVAVKTTQLQTDKTLETLARWDASDVNLYEPKIMLFGKAFVSPTGADALRFYDFYIVDSVALPSGFHQIRLQAIPKTWHGNVFTGFFTVEDSAYALTGADLRLSKTANLNYIESLALHLEFAPAPDFLTQKLTLAPRAASLFLQYESGLELLGIPLPARADSKRIVARMSSIYENVRLNDPAGAAIAAGGIVRSGRNFDSDSTDVFWKNSRPDSLSARESAIYKMADDLRNDPKQRAKDKILTTLAESSYTVGDKLRLGPLGSLVSYNRIEGTRLRLGFRTLEGFNPKTSYFGHFAYGNFDKKWKGSIGFRYLPATKPYSKTEFVASSDYETLTDWYDEFDRDNIANSILRKNVPYYRTHLTKIVLVQDRQIAGNFFLRGGVAFKKISPVFDISYRNPDYRDPQITPAEPQTEQVINVAEAALGLRFAWHEASKIVNFQREPLQSRFPAATLTYSRGFKTAFSDFDFQKIDFNLSHKTRLTPKATLIWNLEAGKVFGTLPTLLLQVPTGNDAFVMSRYAFNTITPYEFSADRYLSLRSRLALGGMIFDRVPLLQKLGWRERLTFNAFWGDLSVANRTFNAPQNSVAPAARPFMETGVGIENIFHLLSIDFVKRLNYLDSPGAAGNRTGVYFGLKTFF